MTHQSLGPAAGGTAGRGLEFDRLGGSIGHELNRPTTETQATSTAPTRKCSHCGEPLHPSARSDARFCSAAHRRAHSRQASIAARAPRARVITAGHAPKAAPATYTAIVPELHPGMYRLKRADGSFSDMVNLTRAKDALDQMLRGQP
jgi:hypothetical protein